jgi:PPM family protein phosphatase
MAAPKAEKMLGGFPRTERKNIPVPFQIHAESRAHEDHPERNEDAKFISKDGLAFGVFDGMGGEFGGQEASNSAKGYLLKALDTFPERQSLQQETQLIHDILVDANKKILREKGGRSEGMNTTASVVRIWQGPGSERKAIVGNVGDSRVYIFRNGSLKQITLDDNLLRADYPNENEAGYVQEKMNNTVDPVNGLTEEERGLWRKRNILTQYLGKEKISPRMHVVDLSPGDQILICSDGISDNLTDMEMSVILSKNISGNYAKEITDTASSRSKEGKANHPRSKKDDMTAIVINLPSEGDRKDPMTKARLEENNPIEKGMAAKVRRSNGEVEYDWEVKGVDGNDVLVTKPGDKDGKIILKRIPLEQFQKDNSPVEIGNISHASSAEELYYILKRIGGIQGNRDFFPSDDIILLLKDFFDDKHIPEDAITNSGGLRRKAIELQDDLNKKREARRKIRSL